MLYCIVLYTHTTLPPTGRRIDINLFVLIECSRSPERISVEQIVASVVVKRATQALSQGL